MSVDVVFAEHNVLPILHQPSADFFHRSHRGLLGCGWEKRTRTILQLPRALGGDSDEAVPAVFQIIRNSIHRVVLQALRHVSSYLNSSRSFPGCDFLSYSTGES